MMKNNDNDLSFNFMIIKSYKKWNIQFRYILLILLSFIYNLSNKNKEMISLKYMNIIIEDRDLLLKINQFIIIIKYNKIQIIINEFKIQNYLKKLINKLFYTFFIIKSILFWVYISIISFLFDSWSIWKFLDMNFYSWMKKNLDW